LQAKANIPGYLCTKDNYQNIRQEATFLFFLLPAREVKKAQVCLTRFDRLLKNINFEP
jgi:hypothetical protein